MNRLLLVLLAGFAVVSCATAASVGPVDAADAPNLLIMGEDADQDTVPRNSRVFKRVVDALSNQLSEQGFDVYDETAVTLGDFSQGRARRSDAEIIDIARSVERPPIDAVLMFGIYATAEELEYTTKINTRVSGRLLQVHTGERLGNFEVKSPESWRAPVNCDRECILETVGEYARILANDLGAVLAEKLSYLASTKDDGSTSLSSTGTSNDGLSTAFTIVFDGFTPEEVINAEEYLVVFQGYEHHRPVQTSQRYAEYWYETSSESARLQRNLNKLVERLGLRARITFSGNTYTLEKISFKE